MRNVYLLLYMITIVVPMFSSIHESDTWLTRQLVYAFTDTQHKKAANTIPLTTTFHVDADWTTGYQITVTLTNPSSTATTSWTASFAIANTNEIFSSFWNANYTKNGTSITVTNPSWIGGGIIPAGGSVTFGFVITNASAGTRTLSNLQATGTTQAPPTPLPTPVLNPISQSTINPSNYTVSWSTVANATSYTLQQSTTSTFNNPITIYNGSKNSQAFTNQANGTYYYRVFASNAAGSSPFSNVQSVTVHIPIPSNTVIVEGYWESWNSTNPISSIVAMKTDIINVSFITFSRTGTNTFSVVGLDSSLSTLTQLVTAAHAAGKKVKVSVGGATYGQGPLLQSTQDAQGIAQALSQFVQQHSLDGVDFDIEDYPAANLQIALLQNTRQLLGNNAIISYTAKTPASTTAPYTQVITSGYQYFNYVSLMAYDAYSGYDYQQDVQALISMGVPPSKIVVGLMPGLDDIGIYTSLGMINSVCQYIVNHNLHGIMFWSLNRDLSNITGLGVSAATNTSWNILHP